MKFCKLSQLLLVSGIGLVVATLLTACQITTIDFVYLATAGDSNGGQIQIFAADSESGALRKGGDTVSTNGSDPVALATTSDYQHLYVANADNDTIVHFTIDYSGKLTAKDTVTLNSAPVALAVNNAGTFLYVVSGTSSATLTEFPLSSGTIGTPTSTQPLTLVGTHSGDMLVPTAVTVLRNNGIVYATAYDKSAYNPGGTTTSTANPGWVFSFTVGSDGTLTPASGTPFLAGVKPSGVVADPTNSYLYVTDFASNQLIGYTAQSSGVLTYLLNGPFRTGSQPVAITIDPRGRFIYVANQLDSSVSAYSIDLKTGTPSSAINVTGGAINSTDTGPSAIEVDPALGRFVYTANYLGNSVSGFRIDPTAGTMQQTQSTPYPAGNKPTAIAIVPHGNHAVQSISQ
ncbi:MAG: beta-propeller fold lactonase family protein [Acidobacteriota bacterium]|nr:beta-propeller fold lactonase family protein [Acidobacteriota bacterium]